MYLSSNFEKCGQSGQRNAKCHCFQACEYDWDQISSGSWHRTLSRIAVAFKLLEDVNDIELVAL